MPLNWLDVTPLSFNHLLLLERVQLGWLPHWGHRQAFALALQANPTVAWFVRHKCPEIAPWLDELLAQPLDCAAPPSVRQAEVEVLRSDDCAAPPSVRQADPRAVRQAELEVLRSLEDLLVYALDPQIYAGQPFLGWDSAELTGLVGFSGKTVLDVGAGTGRLAFTAAPLARLVYAVEPVENLRRYLRREAERTGLRNIYAVDGLITAIPFPDGFADVAMGGHVYGDEPGRERLELERVVRPGGMVILCPGNNDNDDPVHAELVANGYHWSRFEEPGDGWKRKYWKHL